MSAPSPCQCQAAQLLPLYQQLVALQRGLLETGSRPEQTSVVRFRELAALEGKLRDVENKLRGDELAAAKGEIAALQKRVKELEDAVRTGSRQAGKFQRRNSQRKDPKDHKKAGRKPIGDGQDKGRRDYRRPPERIDRNIHAPLTQCPCCGGSDLSGIEEQRNYVIDIVINTDITCYHTQSGHCADCQSHVHSRAPGQPSIAQGAACCRLGPQLIAHAIFLHDYNHMSWRKIADYFNSALQASQSNGSGVNRPYVTHGALERAAADIADSFKIEWEKLIDLLHQSDIIQIDETGWRVGIQMAWLWVFTNPLATVFNIAHEEGRSAAAMGKVLRPNFNGAVVSDFYIIYESFEGMKQKCLSHMLSALKELRTSDQMLLNGFAAELSAILREALSLKKTKTDISARTYAARRKALEARLDRCLTQYAGLADSNASAGPEMLGRRLVNRAKKYRDQLLLFLYKDTVPGTNNVSESRIRRGVCARKTQGCHRTEAGAARYAHSCSIIATEKQHGRDALGKLMTLVQQARAPTVA